MPANDIQVGGAHYQGKKLQHWDIVSMFELDYFQGQITKYVMRWKLKYSDPAKRIEDLKKARHVLDKYIEEAEKALLPTRDPRWDEVAPTPQPRAPLAQEGPYSDETFTCEGWYGDGTCLFQDRVTRAIYRTTTLTDAHAMRAAQASGAYVDQG